MTTHVISTTTESQARFQNHRVVSKGEWVAQRKILLAREKELTRLGDQVSRERRTLSWVRIDKTYSFDALAGRCTLADLFDGRRQLLVQHLMLAPGWEHACKNCSYMADHTDGAIVHLAQRDVTFVAVSRARLSEIERFRQRMGWNFQWVSSYGNDFNRDFHVSFRADEIADGTADYNFGGTPAGEEMPGVSVFWKDDADEVFQTYSTYGRGVEVMMHTYRLLDLTPKGRDEDGHGMGWVRHHDQYDPGSPGTRTNCGAGSPDVGQPAAPPARSCAGPRFGSDPRETKTWDV
jgi:predicted dithiol-disulfide oxidoreductase (DUF899 family)